MDFTAYVLLAAVIVGVTELISRFRARDYWTAGTILIAAGIGGLFGFFHYYPDLDLVEGIAAGFAAAGGLKTLGSIGNKSTPSPSTFTEKA